MKGATIEAARAAKQRLSEMFSGTDDVVGVGLMSVDGGYAVKVNLAKESSQRAVPSEIDGVPVRVEVVGTIRKL